MASDIRTSAPRALWLALALCFPVVAFAEDTGFIPSRHGFSFGNTGWTGTCLEFGSDGSGLKCHYSTDSLLCDDDWGMCGGMSLLAGRRFMQGNESAGLEQAAMRADIINAQCDILDVDNALKFLEWIAAPDTGDMWNPSHSIAHRMKEDWNRSIQPCLHWKQPVVIGLVFDKHATAGSLLSGDAIRDLTKQHQVLAIGYSQSGDSIELRAYDPNYPGDTLIMSLTLGQYGVGQRLSSGSSLGADRRAPRGVMFLRCLTCENRRQCPPPCRSNADCLAGEACTKPRPGKPAKPPTLAGRDPQPSSEYYGYCRPHSTVSRCTHQRDCGSGKVCVNGFCTKRCADATQCPPGTPCIQNVCRPEI